MRLVKLWLIMAKTAAQSQLTTIWAGIFFVVGKILRFLFLFAFLFVVLSKTKTLAGYNREQVIVFFLVFNLIDTMVQFLFRGVYVFRPLLVSGDFDLDLLKPYPSFFRPLFGRTDVLDLITLIPLGGFFCWFIFTYNIFPSLFQFFIFFILLLGSFILAFALHLFICSVCVLTTEVDNLISIYRDLAGMARIPPDVYPRAIRSFLTFIVPVVILISVPAKTLMGLLSWREAVLSIIIIGLFFWGSLRFWRYALMRYSSASS